MAEQHHPQDQAAPPAPVETKATKRTEKREASFAARSKQAGKAAAEKRIQPATDPAPAASVEPAAASSTEPTAAPGKSTEDIDKRYAILDRRARKAKQRDTTLTQREQTLQRAETRLSSTFGNPVRAKEAYDKGEYHEAARYVQHIFGDDFAQITQKIARATAGMDPTRLKELEDRDTLTREKREWEAEKAKREADSKQQVTRQQALATVASKIAGHDALKLRNGNELVLRELEGSWDEATRGFRLSIKQAADKVVADKVAEAEALGLKRHTATLVPTKPASKPEEVSGAARTLNAARGKRMTFEERHAATARLLAKRRAT